MDHTPLTKSEKQEVISMYSVVQGQRLSGTYKGLFRIEQSDYLRPVVELDASDESTRGIIEKLREIKQNVNEKQKEFKENGKGGWAGISDPKMDETTYQNPWGTCVWFARDASVDHEVLPDGQCWITLESFEVFYDLRKRPFGVNIYGSISHQAEQE